MVLNSLRKVILLINEKNNNRKVFELSYCGILSALIIIFNIIGSFFFAKVVYLSFGDIIFIIFLLKYQKIKISYLIILVIFSYAVSDIIVGSYNYILCSVIIRLLYLLIFCNNYKKTIFLSVYMVLFSQIIMIIFYIINDSLLFLLKIQAKSIIYNDLIINLIQAFITFVTTIFLFLFLERINK